MKLPINDHYTMQVIRVNILGYSSRLEIIVVEHKAPLVTSKIKSYELISQLAERFYPLTLKLAYHVKGYELENQ